MSERLLTTGEMIDKLQKGQIAECVNDPATQLASKRVMINARGNLQYLDGYDFVVTEFMRKEAKWRILPEFVSFETAMRALREGKGVRFYAKDGSIHEIHLAYDMEDCVLTYYTWHDLLEGDWEILE